MSKQDLDDALSTALDEALKSTDVDFSKKALSKVKDVVIKGHIFGQPLLAKLATFCEKDNFDQYLGLASIEIIYMNARKGETCATEAFQQLIMIAKTDTSELIRESVIYSLSDIMVEAPTLHNRKSSPKSIPSAKQTIRKAYLKPVLKKLFCVSSITRQKKTSRLPLKEKAWK